MKVLNTSLKNKNLSEKIVFMGRNKNYEITKFCFNELIKKISDTDHQIILTVGSDDSHNEKFTLEKISKKHKIPFISIENNNVNDPTFLKKLKQLNPTILITVQFPKIYSYKLISIPKKCCLNIHRGWPLRGGSIDERAIFLKQNSYYVILHHMTQGIDDGNIIGKIKINISKTETGNSLVKKTDIGGKKLFIDYFLPYLGQDFPIGKKQKITQTKYQNKGELSNKISFEEKAVNVERLCRAFNHPRKTGLIINLKNNSASIKFLKILKKKSLEKPGTIVYLGKYGVKICTKDYLIQIFSFVIKSKQYDASKILKKLGYAIGDNLEL